MKNQRFRKTSVLIAVLALAAVAWSASAFAKDYKAVAALTKPAVSGTFAAAVTEVYLRAEATTLTMPDGTIVPMWGFAQDSAFEALDGSVSVPGPTIALPAGGGQLTIYLDNNLTVPISVYLPGVMEASGGNPVRDAGNRIVSFVHETAPGNTTAEVYTWNLDSGSYVYHSGSHATVQVPMGLYGAVKVDESVGVPYPNAPSYTSEAVIFLHEIDPAVNAAVAANDFGPGLGMTSTTDYQPDYFLINGAAYFSGPGFDPGIPAGVAGETTLIRFFNASLITHVPVILGLHMKVLGEDGNPYPYPYDQYSVELAPLQTKDALITPSEAGSYPIFDRRLFLTNGMQSPGGMLRYLEVQAAP